MNAARSHYSSLLESLRTLPRPVWVLCGGMFINKFGAFVVPFLTIYMTRGGFKTDEVALALSCYGIGNLFAAIAGGVCADTIGRRRTIVLSMGGGALSMLALSMADGLFEMVALTTLAGFAAELYRPAAAALISDLVSVENRVLAFAVYRVSFNAGWMFGPAVGGVLATYSYFYLFVGEAVTCVLFGIVAWRFLPAGVRGTRTGLSLRGVLEPVLHDRNFRILLVTYVIVGALFFQMASTYSVFVVGLGFDEFTYGLLIGSNGLLIVLFEVPMTRITRRFAQKWVIVFGYLLIAAGIGLNAIAFSKIGLFVAMGVFSMGEIVAMPIAMAVVSGLAPEQKRGRYMGAVGFSWSFALIVGPALGLGILEKLGEEAWIVGGIAGAMAAVTASFLKLGNTGEGRIGSTEKHLADREERA